MAKKPDKLPNLEESLAEITQLINTMEHGELSLEQSLNQFERGITLVKHCQKTLATAEQKVSVLMQKNNKTDLTTYSEDNKGNDPHEDTD